MLLHRERTTFTQENNTPNASMQHTPFTDFYNAVQPDSEFEKSVWELASILFDEQNSEAYGVPRNQSHDFDSKIRKDRLIDFWRRICRDDANKAASNSSSHEQRAIACLTAKDKESACESLVQGKNYRLSTLVAQIGGHRVFQEEIASQIKAWRDLNVLSEMSEPIRVLYSLLAGETCVCEGKKAQHIEDKASTFSISDFFGLDWKRAFGLRLYYAIKTDDPIEAAVKAFDADLEDKETAKPGEDVMYALLRLYAASKLSQPMPSLESTLLPQNTDASAMTARLSFQLYFALTTSFPSSTNHAAADTAIKLFAVQLECAGEWLWAMFALVHISDPQERQRQIQALLSCHAKDIHADPPQDSNSTWRILTEEFKIPDFWLWEAKALYARTAEHDRIREANYLVKAGQWAEAHEVLNRVVGPECVIGEEWAQLQGLLEAFRPGKAKIDGWGLGGQVYADYLSLMLEYVEGKEKVKVVERLLESLGTLLRDLTRGSASQGDEQDETFTRRVALQEMSSIVSKEIEVMKEKVSGSALDL